MAFKSGELRVKLLGLALLVGLLLLSHHAAPADATGPSAAPAVGTGKRKNSFSFNSGGRTLTSFSMNHDSSEDKHGGEGGH